MTNESSLVEGEELDWGSQPEIDPAALSNSQIDKKYTAGEVRIVTEQARYPMNTVPQLTTSGNYNLNPEFQRRHRWSREKQSRLIESFIMNVPVPPIFLYEDEYSHYEVMDGLQRLTAITEFYEDRFALTELEEWPELTGRRYSELPEQIRRGIDRRYLSSIILLYETARDRHEADRLKQLVFERINSGGEDLAPQETRNALYPGPMNRLCIELSRDVALCEMWGLPLPSAGEDILNPSWQPPAELLSNSAFSKMEDVELVLRFFAHRQRRQLWRSGTRLDQYLTRYLKSANRFPEDVLTQLSSLFRATTRLVHDVFGETAFWLWRGRAGKNVWVERPTLIAYDSIMFAFAQFVDHAEDVLGRKQAIVDGREDFYEDNYALFDGRKTNASDIARRDDALVKFVLETLNEPA